MTKQGRPFVSFSFPDDLFPRVKESIGLYKTDLRLMTIDTDMGLVVLAPVDENWILSVLYVPELQLGLAIAKTKNVLRMLEGVELPPPPEEFEEAAESNLEVLEEIGMQAASTDAASTTMAEPTPEPTSEPAAEVATPEAELKPSDFVAVTSTVPKKGESFSTALSLDSDLYAEMKNHYRNFGFDVLMLVDNTMTAGEIAESMFQPTERVIELLKWAASKRIVELPRAEGGGDEAAGRISGRFVKCPKYEGDLNKVDSSHLEIVKLCDGSRTTEEVAKAANVPTPRVVQILAKYRKFGMKIIGKRL